MKLIASISPRRRPGRSAVVVLAVSLLAGCAAGAGATPAHGHTAAWTGTPKPAKRSVPPPPPIGTAGTYRVGRYTALLTYRPSAADGSRELRVIVRYPIIASVTAARHRGGLFPLLAFAPGYRQCLTSYDPLVMSWASAGYVVAMVQFPRTNCHVKVPDEADLASQPGDVSYVIGRLISAGREPGGRLSGLIDAAKVAVAGHSDGGDTVAAVVASTCCRDSRVSAAVVLAGAEWPPLPGRYFAAPTVPMLFVQGTADTWNPPGASTQLYLADTRGRRYYLDLLGADHFSPYEGSGRTEKLVATVTLDFLNHVLEGRPAALRAMRRAGRVPGIAELASGGALPGQ